jgi:hypothetical protein
VLFSRLLPSCNFFLFEFRRFGIVVRAVVPVICNLYGRALISGRCLWINFLFEYINSIRLIYRGLYLFYFLSFYPNFGSVVQFLLFNTFVSWFILPYPFVTNSISCTFSFYQSVVKTP